MEQQKAYYAQQNSTVRPDFTYQENPNNANQGSDVNGRSDN